MEGAENSGVAARVEATDSPYSAKRRGSVTFTPSRRLYLIGGLLFAALLICSRSAGVAAGASILVPLVVAGLIYLAAVREFFGHRGFLEGSSTFVSCWGCCGGYHS